MSIAKFTYKGETIKIEFNQEDKMRDIFEKFAKKEGGNIDIDSLIFLCDGNQLDLDSKFISKYSQEMNIVVYDQSTIMIKTKERKEIICQKCKEKCKIIISEHKKEFHNGNKKPEENNIILDGNNNAQNIEESNTIRNICNIENNSDNKKCYICLICKENIYLSCESKNDFEDKIKDYVIKNYLCRNHNKNYNSYCNVCKINLCSDCEKEHNDHEIIM